MGELRIQGLTAEVAGRQILNGVDLVVKSGEVHAVMGPNGAGKSTLSHVLMGKPGYTVTGGSVTIDGVDLLSLPTYERAKAGLFLAMQYPVEVPGVSLEELLTEALSAQGRDASVVHATVAAEAERIGLATRLLDRPVNVDLSGGEKKRSSPSFVPSSPFSMNSTPVSTSMPFAHVRVGSKRQRPSSISAFLPSPITRAFSKS